jgi:hypothetical protein
MARVPYDQGVPTVSPSGPPNDYLRIDAVPGAFGAIQAGRLQQVGQNLERASEGTGQVALLRQDFYNRAAVQNATNQALNIGQQELYDPEKGFLTTQGRSAMDGFQPTMDRVHQGFQDIRDNLQNDAQRIAFDQDARRYLYYYGREAGLHADQQSKAWYSQTDSATLDQSIATSATSWNNPDLTATNLDRGYAALTARSQREGWDPVTFADQTRKFESALAVAQLRAQSITDPAGAMKRYNEGMMPGPALIDPTTGQRTRLQIAFKDVIDESGKEALIRPLQRQMESAAIAGNSQAAISGASPIAPVITARAIAAGIDPSVPLTVAKIESDLGQAPDKSGNPHVGVFQLGPDEWRAIGGTAANRNDKVAQATLGTDWVVGAQRAASAALGRPASGWETYIVHQQGTRGGADLLLAPPTESAVDALVPAYKGDRALAAQAITNNGGSANMTAGQFLAVWQAKYAQASAAVGGSSGIAGVPPPVVVPAALEGAGVLPVAASDVVPSAPATPPGGAPPGLGTHMPQAYDMEAQMVANAVARAKQQFPDRPDIWEKQAEDAKRQILITNTLQSQHDAAVMKQRKDTEEAAVNDYVPQIITDPLHVDLKTMANDTRLPGEKREQLAQMLRASLHDEGKIAAVSHQEATELLTRIRAPNGDPTRMTNLAPLYDTYQRGNLTNADFQFVKNEFESLRTPEGDALNERKRAFLADVKGSIDKSNPLMGQLDMTGGSSFYRLQTDLDAQITDYRKAGKNPFDLLNPRKPDFIGSPENLVQYQHSIPQTMEQIRREYAPASATPAAPLGRPAAPVLRPGGRLGVAPGVPAGWDWHFTPGAAGTLGPAQPTPPRSLSDIFARPAAGTAP